MKKTTLVSFIFFFLVGTNVFASAEPQMSPGNVYNVARALLGFTSGAVNFGVDYELKSTPGRSIGGYFFYQSKKDNDNGGDVDNVIAIGGNMTFHILGGKNRFDIYMAPGFGIAMVKDATTNESETGIGPSLKVGFEYRMSLKTSFGLQYANYYNWFSDKLPSNMEFTSASATFVF